MKIAFIYAGQGSQYIGMGKEFYDNFKTFREVFDNSNLQFDLRRTCFEDPNGCLNKTEYTQPCIVAYQIGITKILLQNGIKPQFVAGVSLGEYTALYTAGVWDEKRALDIVSFRGKVMEECVKGMHCKTVSIIGLSNECVKKICVGCSNLGVVEVTNYCCPGNVTIGGEKEAVDAVVDIAKKSGAKYCITLKSQYPFHTKLLSKAGERIYEYLNNLFIQKMDIPVVFNYIGRTKKENETIPYLLKMQVQSCIYLEKSIKFMENAGVDVIVDIGPQNANSKLIQRISDKIQTFSISDTQSIQTLLKNIK